MTPRGVLRAAQRAALLVVSLLLIAGGVAIAWGQMGGRAAQTAVYPAAPLPAQPFDDPDPTTVAPVPALDVGQRPSEAGLAAAEGCDGPVKPGQLVIPGRCIQAPVVPTERPTGESLRIPSDVHEVGWWDQSAPVTGPGGTDVAVGTTLLVGHVSVAGQGPGALFPLASASPGEPVYLSDGAGHVTRWRISSLTAVPKDELPADVFAGRSGPRRLVMVTCGGPVQTVNGRRSYRDNVIAVALPDTSRLP